MFWYSIQHKKIYIFMLIHSNYQLEFLEWKFYKENWIYSCFLREQKRTYKWGQSCVCMWGWFKVKFVERLFESKNKCAFWEKKRALNQCFLFWFRTENVNELLREKNEQCWRVLSKSKVSVTLKWKYCEC